MEIFSILMLSLKFLAKELDITVVALSQLSRAPETRNRNGETGTTKASIYITEKTKIYGEDGKKKLRISYPEFS